MILGGTYSEVGRATEHHVENLRRQVGVGVEDSPGDGQKTGKRPTAKKEKKTKETGVCGNTPFDNLRKALHDSTNPAPIAGDEQDATGEDQAGSPGLLPGGQLKSHPTREDRPSWMFKARSRHDLDKLDVTNIFRAPPVGSYKPQAEVTERRLVDVDFGTKSRIRSRLAIKLDEEVERLKAAKKPYEHLLEPCISVEMLDEKPERIKPKKWTWDFAKDLERPDMVKMVGICFNENSFTEGVLDGDRKTGHRERQPVYDFAKTSTSISKPTETFFQPGRYKVKFESVQASSDTKNIPFPKQTSRRSLGEVVRGVEIKRRLGDHLPDRSLSRSCPSLSSRPRLLIPNIDKYSDRRDILDHKKPWHDYQDVDIDHKVFHHAMTHDEMETIKATWPQGQICSFDEYLTRFNHLKIQRSYGNDVAVQRSRDNLLRGPVSVELLPEIGESPILKPRVLQCNFDHLCKWTARGMKGRYAEPAARNRDQENAKRFSRPTRVGDAH